MADVYELDCSTNTVNVRPATAEEETDLTERAQQAETQDQERSQRSTRREQIATAIEGGDQTKALKAVAFLVRHSQLDPDTF